jgi:hypothetical protein
VRVGRPIAYKNTLQPDVQVLLDAGKLLIDVPTMARFLSLTTTKVNQLCYTNRIPLPIRLPMTKVLRWSVFELLAWVEAGCPGRDAWMEARGWSGSQQ